MHFKWKKKGDHKEGSQRLGMHPQGSLLWALHTEEGRGHQAAPAWPWGKSMGSRPPQPQPGTAGANHKNQ